MIDDKILIQPFATVLTGILIFVTLERGFKWQASIEERIANYVDLAKKASESVINGYDVISGASMAILPMILAEFLILILY